MYQWYLVSGTLYQWCCSTNFVKTRHFSGDQNTLSENSSISVTATTRHQLLWHRALHMWGSPEGLSNSCSQASIIIVIYTYSLSAVIVQNTLWPWISISTLQEHACCCHPLFPCNVHFRSYWEWIWTNQVDWIFCWSESDGYFTKIWKSKKRKRPGDREVGS